MSSESVRYLILPAIGTLGNGLVGIISIGDLSKARRKYGVKAPDTEMPADSKPDDKQAFKRAYRQYMNLIEWTAISQPIFWVSAMVTKEAFGVKSKAFKVVAYSSVIYPVARLGYTKAYQVDREKRGSWFGVCSMAVIISLLVGSVSAGKILKQEISKK